MERKQEIDIRTVLFGTRIQTVKQKDSKHMKFEDQQYELNRTILLRINNRNLAETQYQKGHETKQRLLCTSAHFGGGKKIASEVLFDRKSFSVSESTLKEASST